MGEKINFFFEQNRLDLEIDFVKRGSECILFIPGLCCYKSLFQHAFTNKNLEKYTLLALDFNNIGSSKPDFCFLESQAEIICELLAKLNLDDINIVGHSSGAVVGLLLCKKIPERIKSLTFVEGNLLESELGECSLKEITYDEFIESVLPFFKEKEISSKNVYEKEWYLNLTTLSPKIFYNGSKSLMKLSKNDYLLKKFLNLPLKKAYFYGERSNKNKVLNLISEKIPVFSIKNSGHFMMFENPKEFYSKLTNFLIN